jgi:menaquinone-9 beta-reductase
VLSRLLVASRASLLRQAIRIDRARIFLDGRVLETGVSPAAVSIARVDLDMALWESARAEGVETRQRVRVLRVSGHGPFRAETATGEWQAQAVINAAGRWSGLNRARTTLGREGRWLGMKAHFCEPSPHLSVDLYFFDGGYCGVQPVKVADAAAHDRVNVCAMVRADKPSGWNEVCARHPALRERSQLWQPLGERVSTSPLIHGQPEPVEDSVLQAGDAAGFVDPFVGDGISLALRGGELAAGCLVPFLRGEIPLAQAAVRYRQAYNQRLAKVFRSSAMIRHLLRLPAKVRKPLVFLFEKNPGLTRYLVRRTR